MTELGQVTITAIFDGKKFYNSITNWGVFIFKYGGKKITAVGLLLGIDEGEEVELTGEWQNDLQWGKQFKIASFRVKLPTTLKGIEGFLASGLIKGVGKSTAKAIVETFGDEALRIIAEEPDRLKEVPKIGKKKAEDIVESFHEKRHLQDLIVFLQEYDIGISQAIKIDKKYGSMALSKIRNDPYVLASEVSGIGFKTADHIALAMGLEADDPRRIISALRAVLQQAGDDGHLYLCLRDLQEKTALLLGLMPDQISQYVDMAIDEGILRVDAEDLESDGSLKPEAAIYRKRAYEVECTAAGILKAMVSVAPRKWPFAAEDLLTKVQDELHIKLAAQQYQAVVTAVKSKVMVITGGPGTGKTTIIRTIVELAKAAELKTFLTAPTGRAAKRMEETTGRQSKTIHRLLEWDVAEEDFSRNQENPLECDLLIIDEMSMVDMALFYHLLLAVPATCQLVFVGDIDQLPSVGPGNVLRDIISSEVVPVVRLTEVFRQAQTSMIVQNAHRINEGLMPELAEATENSDFFLVERKDPEAAQKAVVELICHRIPQKFGFDPVQDIQLLTPMRRGSLGVQALNEILQKKLNPRAKGNGYAVGDKVMQLRNNYEKDVFNGDVGRILRINDLGEQASVEVDYDGHVVSYSTANLDEITLAYATTIHKSQGSEYPVVVLLLHTQHYIMLQRNLLYTGITRGKKLVMVVGCQSAVRTAVKNDKAPQRQTRLAQRLRAKD